MKMSLSNIWLLSAMSIFVIAGTNADELLGCGGFLKSHVQIDFSKVLIKLVTKQGVVKDQTNCAPKTGYYFIPLYDKADYVLQLEPPPGWSFTPNKFDISVDGKSDMCSQGKDINFVFKGFGIAGKVESFGTPTGPSGIDVKLISKDEVRETITDNKGVFFFTPVYPGEYQVVASHKKWTFVKEKISVTVKEGNTELPTGSLVVGGYDVTGTVKIENGPVQNVKILLFSKNENVKAEHCNSQLPVGYKGPKPLCFVTSDKDGAFTFPSISPGSHKLAPFMEQQVHFEPTSLEFTLGHDSLVLDKSFLIVGLTAGGYVKSDDVPLSGVTVVLDGNQQTLTKADGSFAFEKVKPGTHTIIARLDDYEFTDKTVKISPEVLSFGTLNPSAFKVCGSIVSDKMESQTLTMTKMGSTTHHVVQSDANTGHFCQFLTRGKYQIQVNVNDNKSTQFFPLYQTIEVNAPSSNIVFSQLKVTVSGRVSCKRQEDCKRLKVILRPVDKADEMIANVIDEKYTVSDIRPGEYKITLSSNRLCWDVEEHRVLVSNATSEAPAFINTGYAVTFISSHDTSVVYDNKKIQIAKGTSQHCVPTAGSYKFRLESCHKYPSDIVEYQTTQELNEVVLSALKHKVVIGIDAKENLGDLFLSVNIDNVAKIEGPLKYHQQDKYNLEMFLAPGESAILTPQSDTVFYNPPILAVTGEEDCANHGVKFSAKKGKLFRGRVTPALAGVQIVVKVTSGSETLMDETDNEGKYNFPPLDDAKTYEITARKDSYVLVGPDSNGNFAAQKLAEIVVEVVDQDTGVPLQGALLSLSGADSYRSNLQTDENGNITFKSLSPSEYFLKPMMKEYAFEPFAQTINVLTGASERITLKGKRVAYSAYGQVMSLVNTPERSMVVIASGVNNCSDYKEEAVSESNGNFRIRGLVPFCSYQITVSSTQQENDVIERVLPESIVIEKVTEDSTNIRLIVFRPTANMDVYVKVYTPNTEHYRSLRLKVARESSPSGLVHNLKVDNYKIAPDNNVGILLSTPPLPMDGKTYSLQLESTNAALKGKTTLKTIVADNSYKFVDLEFVAKSNITEQHIKQVSVWTLVFIFGLMIAAYNVDKIVEFIKMNVAIPGGLGNLGKTKTVPVEHHVMDNAEIEKIVENINAPTKRIKSKRV